MYLGHLLTFSKKKKKKNFEERLILSIGFVDLQKKLHHRYDQQLHHRYDQQLDEKHNQVQSWDR